MSFAVLAVINNVGKNSYSISSESRQGFSYTHSSRDEAIVHMQNKEPVLFSLLTYVLVYIPGCVYEQYIM